MQDFDMQIFDVDLSLVSCDGFRCTHARISYTSANKFHLFAYAFLNRKFLKRLAECTDNIICVLLTSIGSFRAILYDSHWIVPTSTCRALHAHLIFVELGW